MRWSYLFTSTLLTAGGGSLGAVVAAATALRHLTFAASLGLLTGGLLLRATFRSDDEETVQALSRHG